MKCYTIGVEDENEEFTVYYLIMQDEYIEYCFQDGYLVYATEVE